MPPSPEMEKAWLSEYLFLRENIYGGDCDAIVRDAVEPFVRACAERGWADRWFFIRYSERGFHVRLRFHGERDVLEREVRPALRRHLAALYPDLQEGYPEPIGSGGEGVTHVAEAVYEPETERYGGPDGVLLAEELFHRSSEAALALLARVHPTERSGRLGKGLLAMVVLVHAFHPERTAAAEFARQYGINYLRSMVPDDERRSAWLDAFGSGFEQQAGNLTAYVDEAWERLATGEELSEALDRWRDDLAEVRVRFRELFDAGRLLREGGAIDTWEFAVAAIVPSYVHMMNNRLGVSIQEESYLAYLIHRALAVPAPAGAEATA
ncbi:MAG: lantibiotic biosynthesis protein [Gemmatimonadetes bacterium]|nr:lantibiotic biosynthesis protein [Gemmatimonadota bacterium]